MKRILALLLVFGSVSIFSQNINWEKTDNLARKASFNNVEALADYIGQAATSDDEKVRFIFVWIADNISYDTKRYFSKDYKNESQSALSVFRYRKAVCSGYAALFQYLCRKTNITSYLIEGYGLINDKKPESHAWNAVKIAEKWYLLDVTWASGFIENNVFQKRFTETWFFAKPENFIISHFPSDPMWQLLGNPVSKAEFTSGKTPEIQPKPVGFHYQDTLRHFCSLDSASQLLDTYERALRFTPDDVLMQDMWQRHYYTQCVFTASDLYDEATQQLQRYFEIKYKAFQRLSYLDDSEDSVKIWLRQSFQNLNEALKLSQKASKLKAGKPNLHLLQENQANILANLGYIREEIEFVRQYYTSAQSLRITVLQKFPRILTF